MMLLPQQYNILWATSWIALYPTIQAIQRKKYDLALGSGMVFLTSIHFWKDPTNYRNKCLDEFTVRTVLTYQLYTSIVTKNKQYWYFVLASISSFFIGCHFYDKKEYWIYTYCHMGLHIMSNFACFALLE
jgi:hypothetical protein